MSDTAISSSSCKKEEQKIEHLSNLVKSPLQDGENLEKREEAIIELGQMLSRDKRTEELCQLIEVARPFLVILGKAKAARMVRDLVDLCLKIDQDGDIKVALVSESILWATTQKHIFLRQALQARLIRLYNDLERYLKALQSVSELIHELKKVDNKDLLLEVQLEESKASVLAFKQFSNLPCFVCEVK